MEPSAQAGSSIPPPIAGILLAGVITDAVLFRSPTSLPRIARQYAANA